MAGSGSRGARVIQREIVRSETSKPSMRSSPWMRGAPHVEFSTTMRKINSRISFDVCRLPTGLLTLEISFQYKRNPALCQRTTVSGVTAGLILAADADASVRRVVDVVRDSPAGDSDARARGAPAFRGTGR